MGFYSPSSGLTVGIGLCVWRFLFVCFFVFSMLVELDRLVFFQPDYRIFRRIRRLFGCKKMHPKSGVVLYAGYGLRAAAIVHDFKAAPSSQRVL